MMSDIDELIVTVLLGIGYALMLSLIIPLLGEVVHVIME